MAEKREEAGQKKIPGRGQAGF